MAKLSDIKGEAALDVLADIMGPAMEILSDPDVKKAFKAKKKVEGVALAIKKHKRAVVSILAAINQQSPEEFMASVNIVTLPLTVLDLMNDPDLASLFTLQGQKKGETASGSATENTVGEGE